MVEKEDIMALRKKNAANNLTKIKELLQHISSTRFENDKIQHIFEENETKICELKKEVFALKEEYDNEKQNLQRKIHEAEKQHHILLVLKEEKDNLNVSLLDLEAKHKTLKNMKPSVTDEKILSSGKRKHKLYKEFTGIRWDYSAPENVIEGFITNKKNFLQKIRYKGDIDYKSLKELLWKDIYKSTLSPNSIMREESKENMAINN